MAAATPAGTLRLGSKAPNFQTDTSNGPIDFHEYLGNSWGILFSHPDDFTPVCTTELGAFANLESEFAARNTKLVGLSANSAQSHHAWIKDINEVNGSDSSFQLLQTLNEKLLTSTIWLTTKTLPTWIRREWPLLFDESLLLTQQRLLD